MDLQKLNHIMSRLDGQVSMRYVDADLAMHIGTDKAMLLSRIMILCQHKTPVTTVIGDRFWVKLSTETLASKEHFPWISARTIQRYLVDLQEYKLIEIFQGQNSTDRTNYYSPIWEKVDDLINGLYKIDQCITTSCRNGLRQNVVMPANDAPIIKEVKRLKIKEIKNKDSSKDISIPKARPRDLMFDAVAKVTQLDPNLTGSRIAKASNLLKKGGYIPDDVLQFLTWWKSNDFRWRQSKQPPLPEDITTLIARSKSGIKLDPDKSTSLYPADYIEGETVKEYTERKHDVTN